MNISSLLEGLLDSAALDDDTKHSPSASPLPLSPAPPPTPLPLPQLKQPSSPQPLHLSLPEPPQNGWSNVSDTFTSTSNKNKHNQTPSSSSSAASSFLFSPNTDPNTIFFSGTPTAAATPTLTQNLSITSSVSSPIRQAMASPEYMYDDEWDDSVNMFGGEDDGGAGGEGGEFSLGYDGVSDGNLLQQRTHRAQWHEMPKLLEQVQIVLQKHGGYITAAKLGSKVASHDVNVLRRLKALCGGLLPLLEMYPNIFYVQQDGAKIYVFTKEQWERQAGKDKEKGDLFEQNSSTARAATQKKMSTSQFIRFIQCECRTILLKQGLVQEQEQQQEQQQQPEQEIVQKTSALSTPMKLVRLCNLLQHSVGNIFKRVKSQCGGMKMLLMSAALNVDDGAPSFTITTLGGKTFVTLDQESSSKTMLSSTSCCLHVSSIPPHLNDRIQLTKTFTIVQPEGVMLRPVDVKIITKKGSASTRLFAFVSYHTASATELVHDTMKKQEFWNDKISYALSKKSKRQKKKKNGKVEKNGKNGKREKRWKRTKGREIGKGNKKDLERGAKIGTNGNMNNIKSVNNTTCMHNNSQNSDNPAISNRNIVPSRHLWIGRCVSTSKNHLDKIFSNFGEIETISYDKREQFAFIDYVDAASAMRAYVAMQGRLVGAQKCVLAFGRKDSDVDTCSDDEEW